MNPTAKLLVNLLQTGAELWVENGNLRCHAPEGTLTPAWRKELSDRKEEIIPILEEGKKYVISSFAQQRLWFLDQLEPDSPAYNISAAARLVGALDVDALQKSLDEIVHRHEVLRTTLTTIEGQPVQVITPSLDIVLPVIDLRKLSANERQIAVQQIAIQEAQSPFNLARGPLVRVTLLRVGVDEHALFLTMHHIVSDGWSRGVVIRELGMLYEAFTMGQPSPLAELPIQYADFAIWQRQWLQGKVLETQLAYWKEQLGNTLAVLELPTDRPRPPVLTSRGATQPLALAKKLSEALKSQSQREGVTLFITLLAAFKSLLYRYTGQRDILVGTPIANRNQAEIEGLIGFFVNTLVLRTDLSGNPSFRELLGRVREVALGAYAHQDIPFEMLVGQLQPERDMSRTPLFQVMFVLQNASMETLELPGLTLRSLEIDNGTAKFDLTLSMAETEQGLRGELKYNTDLFDAATMIRLAEHFQILLNGTTANPERRLTDLPFLTDAEQHQLLVEWNVAQTGYPPDKCLHELFEAQTQQAPHAVAAVFGDQALTYSGLNGRANQLAHHLRMLGVGPDVIVGMCLDRSLKMVIGILGILKAGGAYLPLDPTYPKERLAFMLQDAHVPVILTQHQLLPGLSEHSARVVCLDLDWPVIARESTERTINGVMPGNLAYVIYTSGSTGRPKGVLVTHYNVVRLFKATDAWYHFDNHDVWTLFHSYAFDFSVWELWGALLYGGRMIVVPYWVSRTPEVFYDLSCTAGVTVLNQTPSAFRQLVRAEESAQTPSSPTLRYVIFGGETLDLPSLKPWFDRHGDQTPQLVNMYGITETTVHVTYRPLAAADAGTNTGSMVGGSIPDLQVYILDPYMQLVPIGIRGEMYVGGAGVARGYLDRPKLTAERFIPNPFSQEPGARLYRTGDLARYLTNGDIEYLGRIDHQVKVRGFRIELGEIETALGQHPAVRETVVVARPVERAPGENHIGEPRLVAYVVPQQEQSPTISELHRFLKAKLPEYMIPTAFEMLEALPLTPSGKVDRRALPAPERSRSELEKAFVTPRNPIEKMLARTWAQVLGLEQVGVHDNFFELGGDSILSIQVVAATNQMGLHLTPRHLFEHQTIAELALVAGSLSMSQADQGLMTGPVPLTPIQYWFFEQQLPDLHHWNQALLLKVRQPLNPVLLQDSLRQLLSHHDGLRLRFEHTASRWQQTNASLDEVVPFTVVDLSGLLETEQRSAIERASAKLQSSLNLSAGPMIRVAYFDLGDQEKGRLLIIVHHLAVDGVSWRILLQDLWTAYKQLGSGEAVHFPLKTTSFKLWAERLGEDTHLEKARQELDYWLAQSQSASPLPVDHPGGANTVAAAQTVRVSLDIEETQALLRRVPAFYQTRIDDVLLTALVQAFVRWTGKRSLLIDLESHGREDIFENVDLSRTVGWFTSIFPVLLDLGGAQSPGEALKLVKKQLHQIPHKGINYGVLRYLAQDAKVIESLRALPQPEVSFNYLGQFDQTLSEISIFEPAPESQGPSQSPLGARRHLLEINGSIGQGQLQLTWTYSQEQYLRSTVERLAQEFIEALRSIIYCQSLETKDDVPQDLEEFGWSAQDLQDIFAEIGKVTKGKQE